MNLGEFKNIFHDCEIVGEKLVIKSNILKVLGFIKENYHFDILKSITAIDKKNLKKEMVWT